MAEIVREFRITVRVYVDTNKQTTDETYTFDSVEALRDWADSIIDRANVIDLFGGG